MKEVFFPHYFFSHISTKFQHLFSFKEPVWEALKKIPLFFESFELSNVSEEVFKDVRLLNKEKIIIGKNCKIGPFSTLEGPVYLGDGVEIGPNAFIRPYSILDDEVKIGHSSEVKHSILLKGVKLPHFNYVGDSILGKDVNLGAGAICANYKLNKKEVWIKHQGILFETGLKKFGAIIGDGAFIGCNSVTNPGSILRKGFLANPCSNIHGVQL